VPAAATTRPVIRDDDADQFEFAAELVHETDAAYLVNDGDQEHWLPKKLTTRIDDKTWSIPEWLAIERGIA
jgi:hypothetical protein